MFTGTNASAMSLLGALLQGTERIRGSSAQKGREHSDAKLQRSEQSGHFKRLLLLEWYPTKR